MNRIELESVIFFFCRCPEKKIATPFVTDSKGYAEAEIPMYRFAEYNVVNIQCDILVCKGQRPFHILYIILNKNSIIVPLGNFSVRVDSMECLLHYYLPIDTINNR